MSGLLACPCCGGSAKSESAIIEASVWCLGCGLLVRRRHGRRGEDGLIKAIAAWNCRTTPAQQDSASDYEWPIEMIFCRVCGNKRCPHANDPENYACTGSNKPGQPGSAYPQSNVIPAQGTTKQEDCNGLGN